MWTLTPTPTPGVVHKLFWTSSRRAKNDVFYSRMVGGYDWGMGWWGGGGGGATLPNFVSIALLNDQILSCKYRPYFERPIVSKKANKKYWSSRPSSIHACGKIFSAVNKVPLHTAFHYQPPIVLIWLKYCWKGRKISCHPSIHYNCLTEKYYSVQHAFYW